jgi:hypothetical protein
MVFDSYLDVVIHLGFAESRSEPAVLISPDIIVAGDRPRLAQERIYQSLFQDVIINVREISSFGFLVDDHD